MGFFDKAKDAADDAMAKVKDVAGDVKEKAESALHSEKLEEMSDALLDKVNDLAKGNETVKNLTEKIDDALGDENADGSAQ